MKYLIKLNKFEIDKIKFINKLGNAKILEENDCLLVEGNINLNIHEIKEIYELFTDWEKLDFRTLKQDCLNLAKTKNINDYLIKTKFHDKIKISAKSIYKHINPYLKHENISPKEDSKNIIYIEIKKDNNIYYRISYSKIKSKNSLNINFSKFTVILENPRLSSEISDFLRLCYIFKIDLIIITKENIDKIIKKAKEETKGIDYSNFNLKILDKFPDNFILVGFSKHAENNERDLIQVLDKKNLALAFGDDKFGLSQEGRDKMNYMFRLTPENKKPLRASHALSYILGIYVSKNI